MVRCGFAGALMITFRSVTKLYPGSARPALADVDLKVNDGEIVGLVGLNGAGKTTAMRIAAGVISPTSGAVEIDGRDIIRAKVHASQGVGWVPELPNCNPDRRVLSLLKYFAGFYFPSDVAVTAHCLELLRTLGLGGSEQVKFGRLSHGMQVRFQLAAALVGEPSNLLLDEVFSGIDAEGLRFLRDWLLELRSERKSVLLSSHQLSEVQRVADRVAILHQGRILRVKPSSEIGSTVDGETKITLRLKGVDEACLSLLGTFGKVSSVGERIVLSGHEIDPSKLSAELARHGYGIVELATEVPTLEDYLLTVAGTEP